MAIFVGRGFIRAVSTFKIKRLYRLRKKSLGLWVVPSGTT